MSLRGRRKHRGLAVTFYVLHVFGLTCVSGSTSILLFTLFFYYLGAYGAALHIPKYKEEPLRLGRGRARGGLGGGGVGEERGKEALCGEVAWVEGEGVGEFFDGGLSLLGVKEGEGEVVT